MKRSLISAMTLAKTSTPPDANDLGFACVGSITKDQFMARRIRDRQTNFVKQGLLLNGIMAAGAIGTKVLYSMATKSGKRSLYGATAILGYGCALGTIFGNVHICDKACNDVDSIIRDCQGLPEEVAEYRPASIEELEKIRRVQKGLHYDPKVDGQLSIYELQDKRVEEINDLLFKACMYTSRFDLRQLIESEQYDMLDTVKKLAEDTIKRKEELKQSEELNRKMRADLAMKDLKLKEATGDDELEPTEQQ